MSAISNVSKGTITTPGSVGVPSATTARRRRRIVVNSLRVGLLVVIIGGWELATRVGIIDKFFWGQPSGIWAQLVTCFSFALVGAVVGEFVGAIQGIGLLIQTAGANFNANGVFAAMVILAIVALVTEALVTALERRLLRWRPSTVSEATI